MNKRYSWLIAICLCLIILSITNTARAISIPIEHKLYNEDLTLYKSGIEPENIKYFKQALKDNFQATVNALKVVNRYIAAHPHDEYAYDIKLLLIRALNLAETK